MIRFFFEYSGTVVQLPVNPEELTITTNGNNKVSSIVKLGEINILRERKLSNLNIECFLPVDSDLPYVVTSGRFEGSQFYIDFFNKIRDEKRPCRLVVSGTEVNMLVSVEKFTWGLKAGNEDTEYKLELKEYQPYSIKEVTIVVQTPTSTTITTPPAVREPQVQSFAVGDLVVVNGKCWYNSYGGNPYGVLTNYTGKISIIVASTARPYRYHITSPTGGAKGWVDASQMSHKT